MESRDSRVDLFGQEEREEKQKKKKTPPKEQKKISEKKRVKKEKPQEKRKPVKSKKKRRLKKKTDWKKFISASVLKKFEKSFSTLKKTFSSENISKIARKIKFDKYENHYVFGFLTLICLLILYSVTFFLKSRVWGMVGVGDTVGPIHLYWWLKKYSLYLIQIYFKDGFSFFSLIYFLRDFFYYPLLMEFGNFADYFINFLLEPILPFPMWYNVKSLLFMILDICCFYVFAMYIFKNRAISIITALFFGFSPFLLMEFANGRIEQVGLFPVPLFLLYISKLFYEKENKIKNAVLAGISMGVTSILYWFYGLFLFMFLIIFVLYVAVKGIRNRELYRGFIYLLLVGAVCVMIASPFLFPYVERIVIQKRAVWGLATGQKEVTEGAEGISTLENVHLIVTRSCSMEYPLTIIQGEYQYIPVIMTLLVLFSFLLLRRVKGYFYVSIIFFYLMSLGPYIHVLNKVQNPLATNHLYLFLLKYLPLLSRLSWPVRFVSFVTFFACILSGYSLIYINEYLEKRFKKANWKYAFTSLIVVVYFILVIGGGYLPATTTPFHIPEFYLKHVAGGIIELPFNAFKPELRTPWATKFYMDVNSGTVNLYRWDNFVNSYYFYHGFSREIIDYYQVFHQHKIFSDGLYVGGEPRETDLILTVSPLATSNSVISYFAQLSKNPTFQGNFTREDLQRLKKLGYKYIVIHKRFFTQIAEFIVDNWHHGSIFGAGEQIHRIWNTRPDPTQLANFMFYEYKNNIESKFGPPMFVDHEVVWVQKPGARVEWQKRFIDNFTIKEAPIFVYRLY